MHTIALLTQKGGAGKTTLAASLAVAAAMAGEKVIALDLDPQGSLARWGRRREGANAPNTVMVEPLEVRAASPAACDPRRTGRCRLYRRGLRHRGRRQRGRPDGDGGGRSVPFAGRPTRLDVEATAATFRAVFLAKRKAAFVLNQCPPNYRSARTSESAQGLMQLGVLAEPMLASRMDFQDAIAAGLGVNEYAPQGRAAQEIGELWNWIAQQFRATRNAVPAYDQTNRQAAA